MLPDDPVERQNKAGKGFNAKTFSLVAKVPLGIYEESYTCN